jgi:hypothetical protein
VNEKLEPELLTRQPKWFKPVIKESIVAILVIGFIALWCLPYHTGHPKKSGTAEAINNAKQIGISLFGFEDQYGSYPSDSTTSIVATDYPNHGFDLSGTSSNNAFRQLLASGVEPSEQMFYAKIKKSKRPDGDISPGKALDKGEVGFSYISGLTSKDDPLTPIVLTPLIPGTTKFDPEPFKGKAIILRINQSALTYDIHKDGHVYDKDIDILSAKHPMWNGKVPDIRYPE